MMLEKGVMGLFVGRESNIVGHFMPEMKFSQHQESEEKSQMEIFSPFRQKSSCYLDKLKLVQSFV